MASGSRLGFGTAIIFSILCTPLTEVQVSFAMSFMLLRRRSNPMIFSPVRCIKRIYRPTKSFLSANCLPQHGQTYRRLRYR